MRPPAQIKPWLSVEEMFQWLRNSPDKQTYKRRLAIWLTLVGKLHANNVAKVIGASTQAVWLWIRQYNHAGTSGLNRKGRGGRRWYFMKYDEEIRLLKPFLLKIQAGDIPKVINIKQAAEQKLGRKVSMPYVYRLLQRHGWAETIAQSKSTTKTPVPPDSFEKISRPWLRHS